MPLRKALALATLAAAVLTAGAAAFAIEQVPLPDGTVGQKYTFQLTAREGSPPYVFRFSSGNFVPGLRVTSTGLITGTPTHGGDYRFYLEAEESWGMRSQRQYSLRVNEKLLVTTGALPAGSLGVPYSASLRTKSGAGTWKLAGGTIPPGLTLAPDGTISGTPAEAGRYEFTVTVTAGSSTATKGASIIVTRALDVPRQPPFLAVEGTPMSVAVRPIGGVAPYTWTLRGDLPMGVTMSGLSGRIWGVPAHAGRFPIAVTVKDANGVAITRETAIEVSGRLAITTRELAPARANRLYRTRITATGGIAPLTYTLAGGGLPPGLAFDRRTGALSGKPGQGLHQFTVRVSDRYGNYVLAAFLLRVR